MVHEGKGGQQKPLPSTRQSSASLLAARGDRTQVPGSHIGPVTGYSHEYACQLGRLGEVS